VSACQHCDGATPLRRFNLALTLSFAPQCFSVLRLLSFALLAGNTARSQRYFRRPRGTKCWYCCWFPVMLGLENDNYLNILADNRGSAPGTIRFPIVFHRSTPAHSQRS